MNWSDHKSEDQRKWKLRWNESEWRLNFLRELSATPLTNPVPELLEQWQHHIQNQPSIYQPPPQTVWN
jgi:hypothetical protein